jgi:hypothetical protein
MGKKGRRPYHERDDLEKLESQWVKRAGLSERRDHSAAIVRCATAAEIAANIAVRHEFALHGNFASDQVDSFLIWANGLEGKMRRLILPLRYKNRSNDKEYLRLLAAAQNINGYRNAIVHRGEFSSEDTEIKIESGTRQFIESLVGFYHHGYKLPMSD